MKERKASLMGSNGLDKVNSHRGGWMSAGMWSKGFSFPVMEAPSTKAKAGAYVPPHLRRRQIESGGTAQTENVAKADIIEGNCTRGLGTSSTSPPASPSPSVRNVREWDRGKVDALPKLVRGGESGAGRARTGARRSGERDLNGSLPRHASSTPATPSQDASALAVRAEKEKDAVLRHSGSLSNHSLSQRRQTPSAPKSETKPVSNSSKPSPNFDSADILSSKMRGLSLSAPGLSASPSTAQQIACNALECHDLSPSFNLLTILDLLDARVRAECDATWINQDESVLLTFKDANAATIAYASLLSREGFKVQPYDKGASSGSNSPTNSKRPLRTDAVARRLIAGALGINLGKKSAEALARDEEKKRQIIDERREQARAVAKREEEVAKAWDD